MNPAPYLSIMSLLTVAPSAFAAAEADHGASARYVPARAHVDSYHDLLEEVARWSERYDPRLSEQDRGELADWLNRNFYKFEK